MAELTPYQEYHLKPTFERLGRQLFRPMVEASIAHVVMLAETGVLEASRARPLGEALVSLRAVDPESLAYSPEVEDVYFWIEQELARRVGADVAADLQRARSRNDLDAAVFRMLLRDELVALTRDMLATGEHLAHQARAFSDLLIVGYTHRQPAQPTTLGHVLAGYAEAVLAEAEAIASLIATVNRSPLGACAFAGTGFPIDRQRLAELLGFSGLVQSTYEAVAGSDHFGLVAGTVATALSSGARFCRTLLEWLGVDKSWIALPDPFVQVSSIMPQKRNPVVLEHLVALAGDAVGQATAIMAKAQDSFYEDTDIGTTDVQLNLRESLATARRFYQLLGEVVAALRVGQPPKPDAMVRQYVTATQLADALAELGLPFRQAHGVVSRLVWSGKSPDTWTAYDIQTACQAVAGRRLAMDAGILEARLRTALDPTLVLKRSTIGGPGTAAVQAQAAWLVEVAARVSRQVEEVETGLAQGRRLLGEALRALGLLGGMGGS